MLRDDIADSEPSRILLQATASGQAYAAASRSMKDVLDVEFQGGWENIDTAPTQTGRSLIEDASASKPGISITNAGDDHWRRILVNRIDFRNVTRGVSIVTGTANKRADIHLILSNSSISASGHGVALEYSISWPSSSDGGKARVIASNVDIAAGLSGTGHGIYIKGCWDGSSITATGEDPLTGRPRVSTITSASGNGIHMSARNNETHYAAFANTVIYGATDHGIYLDAKKDNNNLYQVNATIENCTVVDNNGDGLRMIGRTANSGAAITNSIFAANSGYGVNLGESKYPVFQLNESHNVFYNDELSVNGATQAVSANSSTADPKFQGSGTKPHPWYTLKSGSPASGSASPAGDRGAYQPVGSEAPNHPPVAQTVTATAVAGSAKQITLAATDADGDSLTYSIVASPAHGTLGSISANKVTYTPDTAYAGTDTFTYKANDGQADSNIATVTITVTEAERPPQLKAITDKQVTELDNLTFAAQVDDPGDATRTLSGEGLVTTDVMMRPTLHSGVDTITMDPDSQSGFVFNMNGNLELYHSIPNGAGFKQVWTEIELANPVSEGDWVRVAVTTDYASSARPNPLFQVLLNGAVVSHQRALMEPDLDCADTGGTWFIAASGQTVGNGTAVSHNSVQFTGNSVLDDVVCTSTTTPNLPSDSKTFTIAVLTSEGQGELDSDGDGIPDAWEIAHGLDPNSADDAALDSDGDGFTNLQEYIAGTDPKDANSFFRADEVKAGDTTVGLKFRSAEGRVYGVERRDSLDSGRWTTLATGIPGTGEVIEVTDPDPAPEARFYRLTVALP